MGALQLRTSSARRRAVAVAWAAALAACATRPAAAPTPGTVLLRADSSHTFTDLVRVEIVVGHDDGRELVARASALASGTTQLISMVLVEKLAQQGCNAQEGPAEPGPEDMVRWMNRVLVLPAGWRPLRAVATGRDGSASAQLELRVPALP